MRKYIIILGIICFMILSACSGKEAPKEESSEEVSTGKQESESASTEEADKDEKETDEASPTNDSPSDVEGILKKVADAMDTVSGMTLTGDTESTMDMAGMTTHEVSKITGETTFNPMAQHMEIHTESESEGAPDIPGLEGESTTETEMYITEEGMYVNEPDSGGWLSLSSEQSGATGEISASITASQFNYFAKQHEAFQLSESDGNYVLSFTGEGEDFKEIAFGALKEFGDEEVYESFTSMITKASGTYEFTISKDTFYVTALRMDFEQTMDMGVGEIQSTEKIHYEYSDFNEVDAVTVPADVIENAQSLPSMSDQQNGN